MANGPDSPVLNRLSGRCFPAKSAILNVLISSLAKRHPIDDTDRDALQTLPVAVQRLIPRDTIASPEGAGTFNIVVDGLIARSKPFRSGTRQITALYLPEDTFGCPTTLEDPAALELHAITEAHIARISAGALFDLARTQPNIALALYQQARRDFVIMEQWAINVGRRDAIRRLAHFLSEMAARFSAAGRNEGKRIFLPLSQQQIADALGLTAIHVNRCLRSLREQKLIGLHRHFVEFLDLDGLHRLGSFQGAYLDADSMLPLT